MFETAKKYSETTYYGKGDLEQEMDHYLVDPLWHEITQYRSFFRQEFPLQGKKTYLIRNPHVNDAMAQTQELLFGWLATHSEEPLRELDLFWLKEDEQVRFSRLLVKLQYDKAMQAHSLFQEIFDQFQLDREVSYSLRCYLEDAKINLLLKLFRICMECNKRTGFVLLLPTLYIHHCLSLCLVLTIDTLMDQTDRQITELDVTSNFLSHLAKIRLKLSDEMISLDVRETISPLQLDAVELIERYPMLQKESIYFYVTHRKLHHYYTLQDYMQSAEVCYETARYSMEKLVEIKWYQKQKIGKKFVYFII